MCLCVYGIVIDFGFVSWLAVWLFCLLLRLILMCIVWFWIAV